jgi:hypothetical protein
VQGQGLGTLLGCARAFQGKVDDHGVPIGRHDVRERGSWKAAAFAAGAAPRRCVEVSARHYSTYGDLPWPVRAQGTASDRAKHSSTAARRVAWHSRRFGARATWETRGLGQRAVGLGRRGRRAV